MANVDAKIDSGNFWVSQDSSGAKFSNYDSKPVAIVSGEDTLVLGRNEGAVVKSGDQPTEKVDVIGRVSLAAPEDNAVIFGGHATLGWDKIEGGQDYWVEIAFDPRFDRMAQSLPNLPEATTGIWRWRPARISGALPRSTLSACRAR